MFVFWLIFFFFFNCVDLHCRFRDISKARLLFSNLSKKKCVLVDGARGVGSARNVKAECKQNRGSRNSFYYEMSWNHPKPNGTPVVGYRVVIMYQAEEKACFQLPPSARSFVFNRSIGLAYECIFHYSVTPQPISRIDGISQAPMERMSGCPVSPILLPLPNMYVSPLSSFSFTARFKRKPVPEANVTWYFSRDKISCKKPEQLVDKKHGIRFTKNSTVLKILSAEKNHIGCYVVTAGNGIGHLQSQRGYLDLNTTIEPIPIVDDKHTTDIGVPILCSIAGAVMVAVIVGIIVMCKRRKTTAAHRALDSDILMRSKVYISHCMEKHSEKLLLLKFASALNAFGFDILIDICSVVEINNGGGLPQWISSNLQAADNIIIIANSRYLNYLAFIPNGDDNDHREHVVNAHKVCTELSLINHMMSHGLIKQSKILVACLGASINNLNFPINMLSTVPFPDTFDLCNIDFKSIIDLLLGIWGQ